MARKKFLTRSEIIGRIKSIAHYAMHHRIHYGTDSDVFKSDIEALKVLAADYDKRFGYSDSCPFYRNPDNVSSKIKLLNNQWWRVKSRNNRKMHLVTTGK